MKVAQFLLSSVLCAPTDVSQVAEKCEDGIECAKADAHETFFVVNNFNDWFQYNKPFKFKWVDSDETSTQLTRFSQNPQFLVDDSCSVLWQGEMRLYGGHWNPTLIARVDPCKITVLDERLPTDWQKHKCVVAQDKLYMNGHWGVNGPTTEGLTRFVSQDMKNKWETLPSTKVGHGSAVTVVYNGNIVTLAGYTDLTTRVANVESYSIEDGKWSNLPSLPEALSSSCGLVFQDRIWVFGGFPNFSGPYGGAQVYSFDGSSWREEPKLAQPRGGAGAVALGNYIYIVGGHGVLPTERRTFTDDGKLITTEFSKFEVWEFMNYPAIFGVQDDFADSC